MLRVTRDDFEKLLFGDTVPHPTGNGSLTLYKCDIDGTSSIECSDIEVIGDIFLKRKYPYPIYISGQSKLEELTILEEAEVDNFCITETSQVKCIRIHNNASIRSFYICDKAVVGGIQILNHAQIGDFRVQNNSHLGDFIIDGDITLGSFYFSDQVRIGSFRFSGDVQTGSFTIGGSSRLEYFNFFGEVKTGAIKVTNNASTNDFRIAGETRIVSIIVEENSSTGKLQMLGDAEIGLIQIRNNSEVEEVQLSENAKVQEITFQKKARLNSFFVLEKTKIGSILISEQVNINSLQIKDNSQIQSISIDQSEITLLKLLGGQIEYELRITEAKINRLFVNGLRNNLLGSILIQRSDIRVLSISDFSSSKLLQISGTFYRGLGPAYLEFTRCALEKFKLIGNNFGSYDFLVFENTDLKDAFIANTSFPSHIQSPNPYLEEENEHLRRKEDTIQKKLFYEQLKASYKKQGNTTEALIFLAKELNQHYKNLFWERDFRDKLNLFFHKHTSNFGTDWVRALLVFVGVSILLYTILLLSTKQVSWPWLVNSFQTPKYWNEYISHYFEFINPTTNLLNKWSYIYYLESLDPQSTKVSLPAFTSFWLYLSKFIMVTLLYQFVQAFRKFGKV